MEIICITNSDVACFQLFEARIASKKYLEIELIFRSEQILSP